MNIEEARLYLEHTSKEDFNLEEHQKENRYQAIQVVLKEIERLNKENEDLKLKLRQVYYYNEELRSNRLSYILNDENIDFGIEGRR